MRQVLILDSIQRPVYLRIIPSFLETGTCLMYNYVHYNQFLLVARSFIVNSSLGFTVPVQPLLCYEYETHSLGLLGVGESWEGGQQVSVFIVGEQTILRALEVMSTPSVLSKLVSL